MDKMLRRFLPFATLALIIAVLSALKPDSFLTADNIFNVLSRSSVNGVIAMGMTMVIISAGIDLSVGSMMALCGMVSGYVILATGGTNASAGPMLLGTVAGLATGIACGLLNGALITKLRLPPFIVTLGTMSAFRGVSYVMNAGKMYDVPTYTFLGSGILPILKTVRKTVINPNGSTTAISKLLPPWASVAPERLDEGTKIVAQGVPVCVIVLVLIVLLAGFILQYTRLGRHTYAIGSNREAAFHAGVNVDRNLIAIYSLTGLLIGIAAMIATSRTVSAQPTAGISLELDIIAAVVIGGASLSGGRGTVTGTVVGTLLISFLRNGCTILGISTNVQLVVIGAIIIGAVALDQLTRTRAQAD
jgi:ribose/xylose/arabinose/galactoside ABC-type transport system permease subunit